MIRRYPKLRWSVRTRFLLAFVLAAVVPLASFAIVTYTRTSSSLTKLESQDMHDQAAGVQAVLRDQAVADLDVLHNYAVWPELWRHIRDGNLAWVRSHVTDPAALSSNAGLTEILTLSGRPLSSGYSPSVVASTWDLPVAQAARRGEAAADLVVLEGRLFVVAAEPVRPSTDISHFDAICVFGRPIDDNALRSINTFTGGKGQLAIYTSGIPTASTDPAEETTASNFNPLAHGQSTFTEGKYTSLALTLTDKQGRPVSVLKVSLPRRAFATALSTMHGDIFWGSVAALALAVAIGLLMATGISRPMRRLAVAATAMTNGEFRQKLSFRRHDEIGKVAAAFNSMSEQVAQRIDDLSQKTQGLSLEIANLNVVGTTLAQTSDVHAELRRLAAMVKTMFGGEYAAIYLQDPSGLKLAACNGDNDSTLPPLAVKELASRVAQTGEATQAVDFAADERLTEPARRQASPKAAAVLAPLAHRDSVEGVLAIGFADLTGVAPEDISLVSTIACQIAVALQNAEAYLRLDKMYLDTVTALAAAMEAKDHYTADHAESMAGMAISVGRYLGLSEEDLRSLRFAAVLHDIGKIGIPGAILNKPGRLTAEEFTHMAEHSTIGERIISHIDYLKAIAKIIRWAHERWDGDGYPDNIAGDEIPLESRILLVCDAFHAMTSDRPYRQALPMDKALAELRQNAGSQFDPQVVDAFLAAHPSVVDQAAALFTDLADDKPNIVN
jgi:HD-GYP domain-containing protein (c-di-GMP phosphodiesterase class II)/sensor domain CHASE-containing protein/HAMP domain-containing protein